MKRILEKNKCEHALTAHHVPSTVLHVILFSVPPQAPVAGTISTLI